MLGFGEYTLDNGDLFYDKTRNPLLYYPIILITDLNGVKVKSTVDNSQYATLEAANAFAKVLSGFVVVSHLPTTWSSNYPMYLIMLPNDNAINPGLIATIIGNDSGYGFTSATKSGNPGLAELLQEPFNRQVHLPLMDKLIGAAKELIKG